MGLSTSEIRLLNINVPDRFLVVKQHDAHAGGLTSAKLTFDERAILSAGKDGIIFCHALDKHMLVTESIFQPLDDVPGIDFMPEA